jgi:hypothetical protein
MNIQMIELHGINICDIQIIKPHGIRIHDMDNKWKTIANKMNFVFLVLRNLYSSKIKNWGTIPGIVIFFHFVHARF